MTNQTKAIRTAKQSKSQAAKAAEAVEVEAVEVEAKAEAQAEAQAQAQAQAVEAISSAKSPPPGTALALIEGADTVADISPQLVWQSGKKNKAAYTYSGANAAPKKVRDSLAFDRDWKLLQAGMYDAFCRDFMQAASPAHKIALSLFLGRYTTTDTGLPVMVDISGLHHGKGIKKKLFREIALFALSPWVVGTKESDPPRVDKPLPTSHKHFHALAARWLETYSK